MENAIAFYAQAQGQQDWRTRLRSPNVPAAVVAGPAHVHDERLDSRQGLLGEVDDRSLGTGMELHVGVVFPDPGPHVMRVPRAGLYPFRLSLLPFLL